MKMRLVVVVIAAVALGCAATETTVDTSSVDAVEDLGALGAKADGEQLRTVELRLEAGVTKRYRVRAVSFHAAIEQQGETLVQLSAKHYEFDMYGEPAVAAQVVAQADDTVRNWTLRVANLGEETLECTVTVWDGLPAEPGADEPEEPVEPEDPEEPVEPEEPEEPVEPPVIELGIVSDIDKTVLPKHDLDSEETLPDAFAGVAALYTALEGDNTGDMYYVTARSADMVDGIPQWMEEQGLPAGPIETGIADQFWLAEDEKVKDISEIFDANPQQNFVMFGDSSHRDPEVYSRIQEKYGERVLGVFIHKVNNVNPDRVEGMTLITSYAQAADVLADLELVTADEAALVIELATE